MPSFPPKLLIIGAGGFGRTVADTVLAQGSYEPIGFLDDTLEPGTPVLGYPVLGATELLLQGAPAAEHAVVAIGDNAARARLFQDLQASGLQPARVLHDEAVISPRAVLGDGVVVMGGAVVGTEARLGRGVIVNAGATVDHHAVVEDFGHIGAGAALAGGARVGSGAWLRAGCVLGYGAEVEPHRILPPGTVLGD